MIPITLYIFLLSYLASILPLAIYAREYKKLPSYAYAFIPVVNFVFLFKLTKMPTWFAYTSIGLLLPPLNLVAIFTFLIPFYYAWDRVAMDVSNKNRLVSLVLTITKIIPFDYGLISGLYFISKLKNNSKTIKNNPEDKKLNSTKLKVDEIANKYAVIIFVVFSVLIYAIVSLFLTK